MPSFNFSTYSVFAYWEVRNLKFWWWLIIVKFSKFLVKRNFDPLPDWIFEKFQRIWKALSKYFRLVFGQNLRFRPRKGSFRGSKLKKNLQRNIFVGLIWRIFLFFIGILAPDDVTSGPRNFFWKNCLSHKIILWS